MGGRVGGIEGGATGGRAGGPTRGRERGSESQVETRLALVLKEKAEMGRAMRDVQEQLKRERDEVCGAAA